MYKTALVTGGSSFIGQTFLRLLKEKHPFLKVYAGVHKNNFDTGGEGFEKVSLDLTKEIDIRDEVDIIFHIAGEAGNSNKAWEINYTGTKNLLAWAGNHSVKKIIYVSSVSVYGANPQEKDIKECSPHSPVTMYGESKSKTEALISNYGDSHKVNYTILQPANVLGIKPQGVHQLLSLIRSIKKRHFFFIGDGSAFFNYVNVRDVAEAMMTAVQKSADNKTFILSDPITIKEAVTSIAGSLSVKSPLISIPKPLGYALASICEQAGKIINKDLIFNKNRYAEMSNDICYHGDYVQKITGFTYPVGIKKTLAEMVDYYQTKGMI
ncbi:NAD-dependent epimerase/dehydratase family protein [Fibrobacterota bacterium]